jgi:hypothetical protein
MSLKRDPGLTVLTTESFDVVFTMLNGAEVVTCRVSLSFLERQRRDRDVNFRGDTFRKNRDVIERAASAQYEDGNGSPRVTALDLMRAGSPSGRKAT